VGERLGDEVDRLPVALDVVDRIGVGRRHLGPARLHEPELEPAARNHVGRGVFLGDAHRLAAQRDQRAEAENARLARLPRENAEEHRVGTEQRVDAGMMLGRTDVKAHVVAQQILVDRFREQIGGNARVTVSIGQAGAHRVGRIEHLLRHVGIGDLAHPPGVHRSVSETFGVLYQRP
jgi:hypothetical protein